MTADDVLLATGDATLRRYRANLRSPHDRADDVDESVKTITAAGVTWLQDTGTWEVDGLVRVHALDEGARQGVGLVDTERNLTLQFRCETLEL